MPRRTNRLQRLIEWIELALHGGSTTVEESAMIYNYAAEKETEVDILITFQQGDLPYRTAVECRDWKRKAGPDWIRDLAGKRDDCRLDRIIAVHTRGFTAGARKTAKKRRVSLHTLDELCATPPNPELLENRFGPGLVLNYTVLSVVIGTREAPPANAAGKCEILVEADRKTQIRAWDLATRFTRNNPPNGAGLNAGEHKIAWRWFPLNRGSYFADIDGRLYEVLGLKLIVRVASAVLPGSQYAGTLTNFDDSEAKPLADIVRVGIDMYDRGEGAWGIVTPRSEKRPLAFMELPPGVQPEEVGMGLTIDFINRETGKEEKFRAEGQLLYPTEDAAGVRYWGARIERIRCTDRELDAQTVPFLHTVDKKTCVPLVRAILSEVWKNPPPETKRLKVGERWEDNITIHSPELLARVADSEFAEVTLVEAKLSCRRTE